ARGRAPAVLGTTATSTPRRTSWLPGWQHQSVETGEVALTLQRECAPVGEAERSEERSSESPSFRTGRKSTSRHHRTQRRPVQDADRTEPRARTGAGRTGSTRGGPAVPGAAPEGLPSSRQAGRP